MMKTVRLTLITLLWLLTALLVMHGIWKLTGWTHVHSVQQYGGSAL